jgi:hypothetical protein
MRLLFEGKGIGGGLPLALQIMRSTASNSRPSGKSRAGTTASFAACVLDLP